MQDSITFENIPDYLVKLNAKIDQLFQLIGELTKHTKQIARQPIGVEQAADFLMKSQSTIYKLCSRNELPHKKKKGKLYFFKDELQQWLTAVLARL